MMGDHRKLKSYTKNPKELKRSRPIGAEQILQVSESEQQQQPPTTPLLSSKSSHAGEAGSARAAGAAMGRNSSIRDKDKKGGGGRVGPVKERWLLTRKTWKYMALAGRRLIPDGTHNRPEDIPRITEHFQHVCRTEQKFLMCSRKSSYPGAIVSSSRFRRRGGAASRGSTRHPRAQPSKACSADEADDESKDDESKDYDRNAEMVIKLLHSYLNISEQSDKRIGDQPAAVQQQQQLTPQQIEQQQWQQFFDRQLIQAEIQSKSAADRQHQSAAAQRDFLTGSNSSAAPIPPPRSHGSSGAHQQPRPLSTGSGYDLSQRTAELLESLRSYSQATNRPVITPDRITSDILGNKTLLRKIYNDLKQQQLSIVLNRHTPSASSSNLTHATSLTSLLNFRRVLPKTPTASPKSPKNSSTAATHSDASGAAVGGGSSSSGGGIGLSSSSGQLRMPKEKYERAQNQLIPFISVKKTAKTYGTQGSQTNFLQLHQLDNMRKEYEIRKKEQDLMNQPIDETGEMDKVPPKSHSRRKSSVDNEDVSQSVSDTIKRYLRMARKKSVNDDIQNRFKRVNYDRNLRNIRAKGEINPPGMDEGNSKATQTLDAWPLLHYNYIRGVEYDSMLDEAHADWNSALQRRTQQQQEYLQQQREKDQQIAAAAAAGSTSPPSSPAPHQLQQQQQQATGLFHSGTQFFSNLWHGYHHSAHDNSNNSTTTVTSSCNTSTCTTTSNTTNTLYNSATANNQSTPLLNQHNNNQTIAQQQQPLQQQSPQQQQQQQQQQPATSTSLNMQKSKSSSNVGQFVSKKIWKSRSKSQSRIAATNKPQWSPQGNCVWTSPSGKRVTLSQSQLRDLTEIERKILHRVAIEKINQLNIGVNVTAPEDISTSSSKTPKRRPLLIKRKALTTSIFDMSKKDDNKANGGLVFGVSIEKCIENDNRTQKGGVGNLGTTGGGSDRGSRNSIISLLGGSSNKGSDHIGSCESLPSRPTNILGQYDDSGGGGGVGGGGEGGGGGGGVGGGPNNFINSSTLMQISRSQSDIRRGSQDEEDLLANDAPPMVGPEPNAGFQVPALILECIKHIEEFGMHTVGIFRVSTSKKRVRQLKEAFDRGEITSIDPETCPHDVATLLKEYLRDLPEPLLCRNLYKAFVKTQRIRNRRLQFEALSHLIQLLPVAHRDTLYILLQFLVKIARSSDDRTGDGSVIGNKMDSNNLATVFAPNILRASVPGRNSAEQEIDEQIDVINVIRIMIDHCEGLFRVTAELMDEIYTNMMDTFPQQLDYLCERRDIIERYDDDMDSAYSSTPLNSPPPTMQLQQSGQFTHPTQLDDWSDRLSGGSRPIYSRDDFLHENTIKGGDPNGSIAMRRRERITKMKYADNDHEMARRRRRERNIESPVGGGGGGGGGTSSPTALQSPKKTTFTSNNRMPFETIDSNTTNKNRSSSMDSGQQQLTSTVGHQQQSLQSPTSRIADQSRRLSSPYVGNQNASGVVKASLKIPVQMQQQQQQQQHRQQQNYCDNSGHLDLSDIPFIEDNGYGQEILTGSLSFGGSNNRRDSISSTTTTTSAATTTYQIPISYDGRILNSPTSSQSSDQTRPTVYQYDDTSAGTSTASSRRSSDNLSQQQKSVISLSSSSTTTTTQSSAPAAAAAPSTTKRPDSTKRSTARKHSNSISGGDVAVADNTPQNAPTKSSSSNIGATFTSPSSYHHISEPKLTPSISNIGGAVLRSKTADFERISKQFKKYKTNDNNGDEQQAVSSTATATTPDDKNKQNQQQQQQQQHQQSSSTPIYKRQELISSAQRTPK